MVQIKIKKLSEDAVIPKYSREGDAAFDLVSNESYILKPGEHHAFSTGIATEFPQGYVLLYRGRSGLAFKHAIEPLAGVIDCNYRGEHKVILYNGGKESIDISKGDRIAQALLIKLPETEIVEVEELNDSNRGEAGFGSSGK